MKSRDFGKQFFPRRVKLALEGIDGRDGFNRSEEPASARIEKDDLLRRHRLGHFRTLKGCPLKLGRTEGKHFVCCYEVGGNAYVRSADPSDVVVPHISFSENPLRASSPTAGFATSNRRRHQGSASRPAKRTQDGVEPTCYKWGQTRTWIVQQTTTLP